MSKETVRSLSSNFSPLQEYGPQVLENICPVHYFKKQSIFCGKEVIVIDFFLKVNTTLPLGNFLLLIIVPPSRDPQD